MKCFKIVVLVLTVEIAISCTSQTFADVILTAADTSAYLAAEVDQGNTSLYSLFYVPTSTQGTTPGYPDVSQIGNTNGAGYSNILGASNSVSATVTTLPSNVTQIVAHAEASSFVNNPDGALNLGLHNVARYGGWLTVTAPVRYTVDLSGYSLSQHVSDGNQEGSEIVFGLPSAPTFPAPFDISSADGVTNNNGYFVPFHTSGVLAAGNYSFSLEANTDYYTFTHGVDSAQDSASVDLTLRFSPATAVPEPGTLTLMGLGIFGMGCVAIHRASRRTLFR